MDCGVQARPVSGVKRGPEDSPCTSSAKRLTTPQPLASKTGSLASPRGAKRTIPFDDSTWRSPNKLHKQGSLEHVRPYMLQQQRDQQEQQRQRQQLHEAPVQAPIPLPPGLQEDMETDDEDEKPQSLPSPSPACQQQQQQEQQQSACAWGSMFGRLGLGEASSSRTTPLFGMASDNKRPPGRPITLNSPSVPSLLAPKEPEQQQQQQQQQGSHQEGAEGDAVKRHLQFGYSHQLSLFFMRNQLN